jgi:hypothetical protein
MWAGAGVKHKAGHFPGTPNPNKPSEAQQFRKCPYHDGRVLLKRIGVLEDESVDG